MGMQMWVTRDEECMGMGEPAQTRRRKWVLPGHRRSAQWLMGFGLSGVNGVRFGVPMGNCDIGVCEMSIIR